MYVEFCSCITANLYFKIFAAMTVGLVLTFIDEIELLHSKQAVTGVLVIALLMSYSHLDEFGAVLLLIALFIIMYNIQLTNKTKYLATHQIPRHTDE